jgi:membrane protein implicated in regulation of membrane protease activity
MFSTTASLLLTTIIISATVFMLMMPLPATAFVLPTSSTTLKLVGNQHSATLFALVLVASIIRLSCLCEERTFDDHHTIRLGKPSIIIPL